MPFSRSQPNHEPWPYVQFLKLPKSLKPPLLPAFPFRGRKREVLRLALKSVSGWSISDGVVDTACPLSSQQNGSQRKLHIPFLQLAPPTG